MKDMPEQMTLGEVSEEYRNFVNKFKPKKTTDDCYTPENIYRAVEDWACREYGIDREAIVRPFWPGADYRQFPYTEECAVVDNPPFSIIAEICRYYSDREIPFFLFAPYLTNFVFGYDARISHITTGNDVTFENGAQIPISFLTNMDRWFIRSVPELYDAIEEAERQNRAKAKRSLPKYVYPDNVITATEAGYISSHGVDFRVRKEECFFIRHLDAQKASKKSIFGGGFLLSEKAAAEKADANRWPLSDNEKRIIAQLGDSRQSV